MRFILCTWFGEFCSCCFLTTLPGPAWVLLNWICKELISSLYHIAQLLSHFCLFSNCPSWAKVNPTILPDLMPLTVPRLADWQRALRVQLNTNSSGTALSLIHSASSKAWLPWLHDHKARFKVHLRTSLPRQHHKIYFHPSVGHKPKLAVPLAPSLPSSPPHFLVLSATCDLSVRVPTSCKSSKHY